LNKLNRAYAGPIQKTAQRSSAFELPRAEAALNCHVLKRICGRGAIVETRFLNVRAETQKTKKRTAGNELPCASSTKNKGVR